MSQRRVRRYSTRPFWYTLLIISIFGGWTLLASTILKSRSWKQDDAVLQKRSLEGLIPPLVRRDEEVSWCHQSRPPPHSVDACQCNRVRQAQDQCAFVKANCPDEEAGLLSYLSLYYCRLQHFKFLAFVVLAIWLSLLFMTIGIAASDFFSPNLSTIARSLGMSQSVAGVTFLAFGNGSPDVFSTLAAMSSHSGSLAVGELIGAASFITAVVTGSMAVVQPFKVARKDFVRDVGFFVVAVSFSMVFMADGRLHLWECMVMVCSYIFYVVCVLLWQWWLGSRKHPRREAVLAGGDYLPVEDDATDVEDHDHGPTNDLRYDERRRLSRGHSLQQVTILEDGETSSCLLAADEDITSEARERLLADLNSNMRICRPSRGERRNTINPIRPSLVGALEFRAILSSREKSPPVRSRLKDSRHGSYDSRMGERNPPDLISFNSDSSSHAINHGATKHTGPGSSMPVLTAEPTHERAHAGHRPRAVSENDAAGLHRHLRDSKRRLSAHSNIHESTKDLGGASFKPDGFLEPPTGPSTPSFSLSPPPSIHEAMTASLKHSAEPISSPYLLAPPHERYPGSSGKNRELVNTTVNEAGSARARSDLPKIQILGKDDELEDSNQRFSFPRYTESPLMASVQGGSRPPSIRLPESVMPLSPGHGDLNELVRDKSIRWWPYKILPQPSVFFSTLFPTIYPWRERSAWEKVLGLVSAPSVFLLTITLPVVEGTGRAEDQDVNGIVPATDRGRRHSKVTDHDLSPGSPLLRLDTGDPGLFQDARTQRNSENSPIRPVALNNQQEYENVRAGHTPAGIADQNNVRSDLPEEDNPYQTDNRSTRGWNRWLVCVQIITAPLFVFLVIWANSESDPPNLSLLWRGSLVTLLVSLIFLTVFLSFTTSSHPPRLYTLLCFVGFVVSIAWIATIAGEVVGVLKSFGVILGISDAILGLTVFAVGNSLGDLVADITVARLGYQMMAFSACFGGPMLNILLGIGCGGLYMMIRDGTHWHEHHPHNRIRYKPYQIEISNTLIISGATLLITLLGLLLWVPLNRWRMDRKIGWSLVGLWSLSTILNIIIEVSGWNRRLV